MRDRQGLSELRESTYMYNIEVLPQTKSVLDLVLSMFLNQFRHELWLLASVQEQVDNCFEEAYNYNKVNWDQVFDLCRDKVRNTEFHDLCPFQPVPCDEMVPQEGR